MVDASRSVATTGLTRHGPRCCGPDRGPKPRNAVRDPGKDACQSMDKTTQGFVITAVVFSMALVGCQSKRAICAQYEAQSTMSGLNPPEMNIKYWKKLGIEGPMPPINRKVEVANNRFCRYYKK